MRQRAAASTRGVDGNRVRMSRNWLLFLALRLSLNACSDDSPACAEEEEEEHEEGPTGSVCNGSTLTYDNFGQAFMEKYCTDCHSSTKKGTLGIARPPITTSTISTRSSSSATTSTSMLPQGRTA